MKKQVFILVPVFLFVMLISIFSQEIMKPEKLYSVQIFSGKDLTKVNEMAEKARSLHYSPVFIVSSEQINKVKVGVFDNFLDARSFRQSLRENGFLDSYITWMSPEGAIERLDFINNNDQLLKACKENITPEKKVFQILENNNLNTYKDLRLQLPLSNQIEVKDSLLREILTSDSDNLPDTSIDILQNNIQVLSNDKYVKGLCMFKLANVIHKKEKNYDCDIGMYHDGTLSATPYWENVGPIVNSACNESCSLNQTISVNVSIGFQAGIKYVIVAIIGGNWSETESYSATGSCSSKPLKRRQLKCYQKGYYTIRDFEWGFFTYDEQQQKCLTAPVENLHHEETIWKYEIIYNCATYAMDPPSGS